MHTLMAKRNSILIRMRSLVMARQSSFSICMLSELDSGEVHSLRPWMGEGLSKAWQLGKTISLKAWIGARLSLFEPGLSLFGIGQSHHGRALVNPWISLHVHSLCGLGLGIFM